MSTPGLSRSGGWRENDLVLPLWQQATLATIHRQTIARLDARTLSDAHDFAQSHAPELIALPGLALCRTVVYQDTQAESGAETGGGLQFTYRSDLAGIEMGMRVPVYHLAERAVQPYDPFTAYQAETVARAVGTVGMLADLADLQTLPDLTVCYGELEPVTVPAIRQF